jgi:hypothetical protein
MTCVSCYWRTTNKYGNVNSDQYIKWFNTTLKINCPYVIFSDKETIEVLKPFREGLPTVYVEYNINDFKTYKYKDRMLTHPCHCPSIELNLIWNEKLFLIKKASELNPFSTDYFFWVDAGILPYREHAPPTTPFPNIEKLNTLPTNRFIYSASYQYHESEVNQYYHHITGTSYILHKSMIPFFVSLYETYLDKLVDKNNIWTDQVILTHIYKDYPNLFYQLCSSYGNIIPYMYTSDVYKLGNEDKWFN